VLWALMFAGAIEAPTAAFTAIQWHAHEMFFGFGWAMLGGFLLTASKNWVKIRGYHGAPLVFLVAAWCFERLGMAFGAAWPPALFQLSNQLFLVAIVAMLLWTLLRHRDSDGYRRDNVFFLLLLPLFPVAKFLLLDGHWSQAGELMALGLFRLAFLIMLERTLTDFMKNVFKAEILRHPLLDVPIKLAGAGAGLRRLPAAAAAARAGAAAGAAAAHPLRLLAAGARLLQARHRHHVPRLPRHRRCSSWWSSPSSSWRRRSGSAASPSTCSPSAPWA
jgi:uncharacterized protein involved in response to NO